MPKVTGYTAASGPSADRSGVVSASTTEKARPSSHRPASHSDSIAATQTSVTAAWAASPITHIGLTGRHDVASPSAGSSGRAGKAHSVVSAAAGPVDASHTDVASTSTVISARALTG